MSIANEFIIENGILIKYVGPGGDVIIPEGVLQIRSRAFEGNENVTKILVPESVTRIGEFVFSKCSQLEEINLPNSLAEIGMRAFSKCPKLQHMEIPGTYTEVQLWAFADSVGLESVTLREGVQVISFGAFAGCSNLKQITLPDSLIGIAEYAFQNCKSLKTITLPHNVAVILEKAFDGCNKNLIIHCSGKVFSLLDRATKDNLAIQWLTEKANFSAEQTDAIKKYIGRTRDKLFVGVKGDNERVVAKLLECGKIKPEKLEEYIRKCNDGKHPKMLAVLLNHQNQTISPKKKRELVDKELGIVEKTAKDWAKVYRWTEEDDGIVITKYKGIDAEVSIPVQIDGKNVIKIGKGAFKGNDNLEKLILTPNVVEILDSAFENCEKLSEIAFCEGLQTIGKRAFFNCRQLTTVRLPEGLSVLGANAFGSKFGYECQYTMSLSAVYLPSSIKKFADFLGDFWDYKVDLYFAGTNTKIKFTDFNLQASVTLHVPAGSKTEEYANEVLEIANNDPCCELNCVAE